MLNHNPVKALAMGHNPLWALEMIRNAGLRPQEPGIGEVSHFIGHQITAHLLDATHELRFIEEWDGAFVDVFIDERHLNPQGSRRYRTVRSGLSDEVSRQLANLRELGIATDVLFFDKDGTDVRFDLMG